MPQKSEGAFTQFAGDLFVFWLFFKFGIPGMVFDMEMSGMYLHKTEDRRVYPAQDERVHV